MTRVRMKIGITGTRDGAPWPARGGEIDLPDAEADSLIAAGYAEPVEAPDAHADQPDPATEPPGDPDTLGDDDTPPADDPEPADQPKPAGKRTRQ